MRAEQPSSSQAASRDEGLHGNAPDSCSLALLLVDVINDFDFEGGAQLLRTALPAARQLASLRARAHRAGVPCIYANDNFGRWRSDFSAQVEHCLHHGRGAQLVSLLAPTPQDYFVLKPKHSAFYQTCLALLLQHLGVKTLLIGGFSAESCVSFSAADAYLRGYTVVVPSDGTASRSGAAKRDALAQLARSAHVRAPRAQQIRFARGRGGVELRLVKRR
jgi:nicotinamidase-related amidase